MNRKRALRSGRRIAREELKLTECGECTACCWACSIKEIEKPTREWCPHAVQGTGCAIHEDRPSECRTYFCAYRMGVLRKIITAAWRVEPSPEFVERYRPDRCGFIIDHSPTDVPDVDIIRIWELRERASDQFLDQFARELGVNVHGVIVIRPDGRRIHAGGARPLPASVRAQQGEG